MTTDEMIAAVMAAHRERDGSYPRWKATIPMEAIRVDVVLYPRTTEPFYFSIEVPRDDVNLERWYVRPSSIKAAIERLLNPTQIAALDWRKG